MTIYSDFQPFDGELFARKKSGPICDGCFFHNRAYEGCMLGATTDERMCSESRDELYHWYQLKRRINEV